MYVLLCETMSRPWWLQLCSHSVEMVGHIILLLFFCTHTQSLSWREFVFSLWRGGGEGHNTSWPPAVAPLHPPSPHGGLSNDICSRERGLHPSVEAPRKSPLLLLLLTEQHAEHASEKWLHGLHVSGLHVVMMWPKFRKIL